MIDKKCQPTQNNALLRLLQVHIKVFDSRLDNSQRTVIVYCGRGT